jgi:hypothetical protein
VSEEQEPPEEQPQPAWRRVTSSTWMFAVGVSVVALGVGVALIFAGSGDSGGTAGDRPTESSTPLDPVEQCVVTVSDLLRQSVQAMDNGYQRGIDLNDVARQYGTNSRIWYAFAQSQSRLQLDVYSNGEGGALTRIQPFVRDECENWVPQG